MSSAVYFGVWHGCQSRRKTEKAAADARMIASLKERDELFDRLARLPPAERDAASTRIAAIARQIAEARAAAAVAGKIMPSGTYSCWKILKAFVTVFAALAYYQDADSLELPGDLRRS